MEPGMQSDVGRYRGLSHNPARPWRELMGDPTHGSVRRFADLTENFNEWCLVKHWVGRIVQDYAELHRALRLHLRVRTVNDDATNKAHWRVVFQRFPEIQFEALIADYPAGVRELQFEALGDDGSHVYYPVFVGVGEIAENGEFVVVGSIPSLIRLVLVEPSEVCQSSRIKGYLSGIRVVMSTNAVLVRIEEPRNVLVKGLQMFESTGSLGFGAFKRGSHASTPP